MHTAYHHARAPQGASLILFADADTWFAPGALRAAARILRERELELLSLLPTLATDDSWERTFQPACAFELVRQFPLDLVNRKDHERTFANGQFMLFDQDAYDSIGGHTKVKDELLEDIAIARYMTNHGLRPVGCAMADGLVGCKMYDSAAQFRRGWKRIFTEAARRKPERLRKNANRLRITAVGLPGDTSVCFIVAAALLATRPAETLPVAAIIVSAASLMLFFTTIAIIYRSQRVPLRFVLLYPLAAWRTANLLDAAANDLDLGRATEWGGRSYSQVAHQRGKPKSGRPKHSPPQTPSTRRHSGDRHK
jgi:hypothetical protein